MDACIEQKTNIEEKSHEKKTRRTTRTREQESMRRKRTTTRTRACIPTIQRVTHLGIARIYTFHSYI
jgi:hypothetical protein